VIFAVESIADCWEEWRNLAASHWEGPFNPDAVRYKRNSETGWFILCTGRDHGKMVAYCGLYVMPSMHTQELRATEDFVYIAPDYRKGRNAALFYRFCESAARKAGAKEVFLMVSPDSVAEKYLAGTGYTKTKVQYGKKLT